MSQVVLVPASQTTFIPTAQVRARYGGVSRMWIERRLAKEDSTFPKPIYITNRRFWRVSELEAWEQSLTADQAQSNAA